jgi:DNA-binding response OmpR family regulator
MTKLLVIEDDELLMEAYQRKYEDIFDLRIVSDGEVGLKMAKDWLPRMILLDIYLPGKYDGVGVLEELKKDDKTSSIPVLVVTNLPNIKDKVMALGAIKCLMKTDIDLDILKKEIEAHLATK